MRVNVLEQCIRSSGINTLYSVISREDHIYGDVLRGKVISRYIARSHIYHMLSRDEDIQHVLSRGARDNQALSRGRIFTSWYREEVILITIYREI
jgi:hypothetical protein